VLLDDTVFIGDDDNSGGGSQAGLDTSETYTPVHVRGHLDLGRDEQQR
jgi:hypothetical protein